MKSLLFLAMLFLSVTAFAQDSPSVEVDTMSLNVDGFEIFQNDKIKVVKIMAYDKKAILGSIVVSIDFGQGKSYFTKQDIKINGTPKIFPSITGAIALFENHGFEIVQYTSCAVQNSIIENCLMRRKE
ncbi:MAG: hypothetical protein AAFQ92_22615 [Bacteroidota bacterium]